MKRMLLALLPWMAMTSAVRAQVPVGVVFTHFGVVNERCFRVDDECFVPLTFLNSVGWSYARKGGDVEVLAEGQRVRVGLRDVSGQPSLPLRTLLDKVGAESTWDGDQLIALSRLETVSIQKGHFTIDSSLPVHATVTSMDDPDRVVVDLEGAKLTRRTRVDLDGTSRISQWKPDTVRIVLETGAPPRLPKGKLEIARSFDFNIEGLKDPEQKATPNPPSPRPDPVVDTSPRIPLDRAQQVQYDPASNPDMQPPVIQVGNTPIALVGPLTLDQDSAKSAALTLKVSGGLAKMPVFRRPDADVIEIVIPSAKSADNIDFQLAKGASIQNVATRDENGSFVIALTLVRPMGVEFSTSGAGLQILLLKPEVGNGRLAGKTVVVDAGHGGHDAGTQSAGINEKDLTLAISKLLSQKLANEGATVIMTRKTDVFIPLNERPAVANRNGADFFVSIHINSNELDNSASGSITFFHGRDPIAQLMADCIQREIVKVNGFGGMGVWSDQRIYNSGFAVLRGAKMPAVLVECGFLNTRKDRARMLTDDFKDVVATAIVKGLKVYLGDEKKN